MKKIRVKGTFIVGYFLGYTDVNHTVAKVLLNHEVIHYDVDTLTDLVTIKDIFMYHRDKVNSAIEKLTKEEAKAVLNTIFVMTIIGLFTFAIISLLL